MNKIGIYGILFLVLIITVTLQSCIMDRKPLQYAVMNCTNDTLFIELTDCDTLEGYTYEYEHTSDSIKIPQDTMVVYIKGKKTILSYYSYTLPGSISGGIYPLPKDTCYVYAIKRYIATHYLLDEIRAMKLYDRTIVTRKDFSENRLFEYHGVSKNQ